MLSPVLIASVRFTRLLAAWANTIAWCVGSLALSVVAPRAAWWHVSRNWGRLSCGILGVHCHVEGADGLTPGALFVQNHDSFSDIFTVPAVFPRGTKFVVKHEIRKVPFFGWAARVGVVYIDRAKGSAAKESISSSLDTLPEGWSMFIFPEGTRSLDGELGRFKKGVVHMAVQCRRPIVPVGTYGSAGVVPPKGWLIRSGPIEYTVGAPIDTAGWTLETADAHLAELREAIEALKARSRERYEAQHGPLDFGGARTVWREVRGVRAG